MVSSDINPALHEATRNACRVCSPLGASLAFAGMANTLPYLHGGQGCATYIRRYTISHFREPIDIASSSFGEEATVFGGKKNLFTGLKNVIMQYHPEMIGIASTCLSETIGEDVAAYINEFRKQNGSDTPEIVFTSTPSYNGSHYDGFQRAVYAVTTSLAVCGKKHNGINVLPGMISTADLRHLQEICGDFALQSTILPDYSETMDGPSWVEYRRIPEGGTPLESIRNMGGAVATIEFNRFLEIDYSAGNYMEKTFGVKSVCSGIPIGVVAVDQFLDYLKKFSGHPVPEKYLKQRGRLLDSYVDAHKYVFGKKALVYGDADFAVSLGVFLAETGMVPFLCISGKERNLRERAFPLLEKAQGCQIIEGMDFLAIEEMINEWHPDILIGSSKGYPLARRYGIPLVRLGFPVHDRLGAARLRCLGYEGTHELFDRIVNSILRQQQDKSVTGYSYM